MATGRQVNMIGKKFGKLLVLSRAPSIFGGQKVKRFFGAWNCQCDCGNKTIVKTSFLNNSAVRSCGCLVHEGSTTLLPGQKFGRLTTISYKNSKWFCVCECGEHIEVTSSRLISGNTKSCGCLNSEVAKSKEKINKLIEGRRQNEPRIASARRKWQGYYYFDLLCDISFEDFMIVSQQNCFYCDIIPSTQYNYFAAASTRSSEKSKREGLFIYNGLDRVDLSKPHTIQNIVPCCYTCNRAKSNYSAEIFLQWVDKLKINMFAPIQFSILSLPDIKSLQSSIREVFRGYKKDSDMTIEEFYTLSQMNCFYCNTKPSNSFNAPKNDKRSSKQAIATGTYTYNGLDRIDINFPHNKDNVVPCCRVCNWAKSDLSLGDFNVWITRIQQFQSRKHIP